MSLFLINTEISSPFLELFSVFFLVNSRFFYLFTRILFTYYCFFFATLRYAHTFLGEVKNLSSSALILVWLCCRSFFLFNLFYHTYRVGRMYSKENPKNFRFSVSGFYPGQWVMLFLCTKTSFRRVALSRLSSDRKIFRSGSSLAALPLRLKEVLIWYLVQNFRLALLA